MSYQQISSQNEGQAIHHPPPVYVNQQQPIPVYSASSQPSAQYIPNNRVGEQQPIIIVPVSQPSNTTTIVPPNQNYRAQANIINDDPSCLYVCSCIGFFIPLVGLIIMCIFGCGSGLPPRQTQAFKVLVACTLAGIIANVIIYSSAT
mmetsp:Transcript_68546/g.61582  ORF Transcript_68546/g.61582 Transcript_68546/m.61582 type:complete len:147 (+) Transcript_68546:88-528(+)